MHFHASHIRVQTKTKMAVMMLVHLTLVGNWISIRIIMTIRMTLTVGANPAHRRVQGKQAPCRPLTLHAAQANSITHEHVLSASLGAGILNSAWG